MLWQDIKQHPMWLAASIVVHVLVMLLMSSHLSLDQASVAVTDMTSVIQAVAVSSDYLMAERKRKRIAEQRIQEQQQQVEIAREQAKAAAQREAMEIKARQELIALEQQQVEIAREQAKATAQREAMEIKARQEKMREQELVALEQQRQAEEQVVNQHLLDRARLQYEAALKAHIQANWTAPRRLSGKPSARIEVRQLPGGLIAAVRLLQCNGIELFCRSVEAAVWRSDPLPMPPRDELFDQILIVTFSPD